MTTLEASHIFIEIATAFPGSGLCPTTYYSRPTTALLSRTSLLLSTLQDSPSPSNHASFSSTNEAPDNRDFDPRPSTKIPTYTNSLESDFQFTLVTRFPRWYAPRRQAFGTHVHYRSFLAKRWRQYNVKYAFHWYILSCLQSHWSNIEVHSTMENWITTLPRSLHRENCACRSTTFRATTNFQIHTIPR